MSFTSRNWSLFTCSVAILRANPILLALPTLAVAAFVAELGLFVAAAVIGLGLTAGFGFDPVFQWLHAHAHAKWLSLAFLVPCYVVLNFTMIYFNAALVACVHMQFEGKAPTLGGGMAAAWAVRGRILGWSFATGLVSAALNYAVKNLPDGVGDALSFLGGLAWSVATFFVVPILVFEDVGVIDAIKGSAGLIKKTWGEQVVINIGFSAFGVVLVVLSIIAGGLVAWLGASVHAGHPQLGTVVIIAGIGLALLLMSISALVIRCLEQIVATALYIYARTGRLPNAIPPELLPVRAT